MLSSAVELLNLVLARSLFHFLQVRLDIQLEELNLGRIVRSSFMTKAETGVMNGARSARRRMPWFIVR
ncbi:MAG: hypothetical protein R3B96_22750 [Pirellulaceae bacterium]